MVPRLLDILNLLEEIAPSHSAEDWDNTGLQIGDLSQRIGQIFISLDPTLKAVKRASKNGAQLLLTHHPLIFKPLSHIVLENYPGNVVFEAAKQDLSILAAHTNLDMAEGGINDMLAELFHLKNVAVLEENEGPGNDGIGLGRIGDLAEPVPLSSMIQAVKSILGLKIVRFVGRKNRKIRRLAVVGGSGGDMVIMASNKGADLLLTGDITHHVALEAENLGLALIDGGHFETEKAAFMLFAERLRDFFLEKGWEIKIMTYGDEKNPIQSA